VDGAGRFRTIWNITVPGIMPTYFVLLLLTIANFINNGLEQYFVFQNAINKNHIEVLDLYVYNTGLVGNNFSFATAVSMLKSVISIILLFFANGMSKLLRGESII
jgi:putative aldouronate transport system permease protein